MLATLSDNYQFSIRYKNKFFLYIFKAFIIEIKPPHDLRRGEQIQRFTFLVQFLKSFPPSLQQPYQPQVVISVQVRYINRFSFR